MGMLIDQETFNHMLEENIAWLERQPDTLERNHIILLLKLELRTGLLYQASADEYR